MKEISDYQKVSLIFSIEEDGKKVNKDKWGIEIGKKYIIGRSKKRQIFQLKIFLFQEYRQK